MLDILTIRTTELKIKSNGFNILPINIEHLPKILQHNHYYYVEYVLHMVD